MNIAELLGILAPVAVAILAVAAAYILAFGRWYYTDEIGWTLAGVATVAFIVTLILTFAWAKSENEACQLFAKRAEIGWPIAMAIGGFFGGPAILADTVG